MAITNARVLRPARDLVLVWTEDPSVGGTREHFDAYLRDGDISRLSLDGHETRFFCRLLSGEQWQECREAGARYRDGFAPALAMVARAFELGVRRIGGWSRPDGTVGDLPRDQWLEALPDSCRDQIGALILGLSRQSEAPPAEESIPLS